MLDDLLKILIDCGLDFPKDSRTLKGTPRDKYFCKMQWGVHLFRSKDGFTQKFHCDEDNLKLAINTDRIPLFKSSSEQL